MNFFQRALANISRKKTKSILLLITFFVIGNFVIIGLGVSQAATSAKTLTRQKMRAVVSYEIDYDAIREYITNDLDSGVTIFNAKDNDDEEKSVLMASVSNEHYYKFRKNIKKIDKDAFFVTTDSYEVNGGRNN